MKETAFLELIKENERQILHVCRYYSAIDSLLSIEDLFQEILYHLWKSYPKFTKRPDCKISTWVYRVALNVAISFARKSSPKCSSIDDLETIDIAEEGQSDIKTLYELIGLLAEEDQVLLFLYIDGKTHQEIAEIMGMSTSNVGNKIFHFRKSEFSKSVGQHLLSHAYNQLYFTYERMLWLWLLAPVLLVTFPLIASWSIVANTWLTIVYFVISVVYGILLWVFSKSLWRKKSFWKNEINRLSNELQ